MRQGDVEFIVNEEKGIVVCKIWDCGDIAFRRIQKYTGRTLSPFCLDYDINDVYVGVAKCSPEDTFNLGKGKKIALVKAKRKRGIAVNKAIAKYIADEKKKLQRLIDCGLHELPQLED